MDIMNVDGGEFKDANDSDGTNNYGTTYSPGYRQIKYIA